MYMKRIIFYKLIVFFLLFKINLIFPNESRNTKIKMFCSDWPVWETARAMKTLGKLSKEFSFYYRDYTTNIDRFKDNTADITFLTLYDFIYTQRENQDGVIIGTTDYSSGGDKIFVRSNINSVKDLIEKKWTLQSNSISLWLTNIFLKKYGFNLDNIIIKHTIGENIGKQFINTPSIVACVGWNPNFDIIPPNMGKVISSSADFPKNIFDVIVVKRKSLRNNRELYKQFLTHWYQAINDNEIKAEIAKNLGVNVEEYLNWLKDAHIYKTKNEALLAFPEMKQVAKDIISFFNQDPPKSIKRGATKVMFAKDKTIDINNLFDDSLLR